VSVCLLRCVYLDEPGLVVTDESAGVVDESRADVGAGSSGGGQAWRTQGEVGAGENTGDPELTGAVGVCDNRRAESPQQCHA